MNGRTTSAPRATRRRGRPWRTRGRWRRRRRGGCRCPSAGPRRGRRRCPEGPAQLRPLEEQREHAEHGDGAQERDQREPADRDLVVDRDRARLELADVEALRVGGVLLEQQRSGSRSTDPNVATIGNAGSTPTTRSNTSRCSTHADHERGGQHDEQRQQRVDVERRRQREGDEGGEDRQVAVGEVDEPHHAEAERQAGGEQRVQPAERMPWTMALTQVMRRPGERRVRPK